MKERAGESPVWEDAREQLRSLEELHLLRETKRASNPAGPAIVRNGQTLWNFSSNNYLDLATHPHVLKKAQEALEKWGTGAGGSRLITGTLEIHEELEWRLSRLKKTETALVFSSGYLANIGVIQALSRTADGTRVPILFDKHVHASLIDAILLSGSPWKSFPHNDIEAARRIGESLLQGKAPQSGQGKRQPRILIVTEGVFSMDGDVAPLDELYKLTEQWEGLLIVDDAHGTGVVGFGGSGVASIMGVAGAPRLVQVGTLSKALASQGGFVACANVVRDLLVNRARAFIFDTALAPPCVGAALGALDVLENDPDRLAVLAANVQLLRDALRSRGFEIPESPSAIIPVMVHDSRRAPRLAEELEKKGYLVVAIRPPTVPPQTDRLRITVMVTHPQSVLASFAEVLGSLHAADLQSDF
jgi:8-amino-7-oxononanoate synthase